jgi:hypothetical protein
MKRMLCIVCSVMAVLIVNIVAAAPGSECEPKAVINVIQVVFDEPTHWEAELNGSGGWTYTNNNWDGSRIQFIRADGQTGWAVIRSGCSVCIDGNMLHLFGVEECQISLRPREEVNR